MSVKNERLTQAEYTEMERDIDPDETVLLHFLKRACHEPDLVFNGLPTMVQYLKLDASAGLHDARLFEYLVSGTIPANLNKATVIRLQNTVLPDHVYERQLIKACDDLKKARSRKHVHFWKVYNLLKLNVTKPNQVLKDSAVELLKSVDIKPSFLVQSFLDLEPVKSPDLRLYEHQRQLFRTLPGLVLLTAPTGTGKTLSPIGLAEKYIVVFLCGARHVCLALAQKCIAAKINLAFAFGCTSTADVRLHNSSVHTFGFRDKSGAMRQIDHLDGRKVRFTISDPGSISHLFQW